MYPTLDGATSHVVYSAVAQVCGTVLYTESMRSALLAGMGWYCITTTISASCYLEVVPVRYCGAE